MVETLVSIAIIGILAALLGMALPAAKRSAKATRSVAHMRQIAIAVKLYEEEWGMIPFASEDQSMTPWHTRFRLSAETFVGCGFHPHDLGEYSIVYFFVTDRWPYAEWIATHGDALPVAFDLNCSEPDVHVLNPFESKFALGVNLGGSALRKRATGDPFNVKFWIEEG